MDLKFKHTSRGFARYDFRDFNGQECSLQKSSLVATMASDEAVEAIWFGCEHEEKHRMTGEPIGARMHLTRAQVAALLPILNHFMMTGEVSDSPDYVLIPDNVASQ